MLRQFYKNLVNLGSQVNGINHEKQQLKIYLKIGLNASKVVQSMRYLVKKGTLDAKSTSAIGFYW